jgi:outer membrane protein assembly factor BamB
LVGSPLVTQNLIYQPSTDGNIYAIDLTGKQVWAQETGGPLWAQPTNNSGCNCVFVASMDHRVYSYDASTGRLLWQSPDLGGALVGSPVVSTDGVLFVGTFGKEMIAMNDTNGDIRWRFSTQDWVWSGPALANNVLYFGDLSGYFYALDATNGTSKWRIQPKDSIVDTPIILDDKIYFTTESESLFIVNSVGDIVNTKLIGGLIYSSPLIVSDTILVSPTNFESLLIAMNLDGNQKWTFIPAKK